MRYAKIENEKVVSIQSGLEPTGEDWSVINKLWTTPTEYPLSFYANKYTTPVLKIEGGDVNEYQEYSLRDVDNIKELLYVVVEELRWAKELAGFEFEGKTIPSTQDAQTKIEGMPASVNSFKIGTGEFIPLVDTSGIKQALVDHVQSGYEWEHAQVDSINACTTHDELLGYHNLLLPVPTEPLPA